jgi:hypothetical protein
MHPDGGAEKAFRVYSDHGYCVDTETEILSRRGWLRWDEVQPGEEVLTYRDKTTRWEPVQAVIRLPAAPRRMLSMETKTHSSLTTEDHRWLVRRGSWSAKSGFPKDVFTTSREGFRSQDHIPAVGGPCISLPDLPKYSDAFVELVGWFFTEGSIWKSGGRRAGVAIHQSHRVNPQKCDRIRAALRECYGEPSETIRVSRGWRESVRSRKGMTEFIISTALSGQLLEAAPGKVVTFKFLSALTRAQLVLFTETALSADGVRTGNWRQLCQADQKRLDAFQAAFLLLGVPARIWQRASGDWACQVHHRHGMQPSRNPGKVRWVEHGGPVWCVRTPSGTWVARRNGTVYVTGNCFAEQKYFSPVILLVLAWGVSKEDAAVEALRRAGWKPVDYAHLWENASREEEPDRKALAEALRESCRSRCPDWGERQYREREAAVLSSCLALLPLVKTGADCVKWLEGCQRVMAPYLTLVKWDRTLAAERSPGEAERSARA